MPDRTSDYPTNKNVSLHRVDLGYCAMSHFWKSIRKKLERKDFTFHQLVSYLTDPRNEIPLYPDTVAWDILHDNGTQSTDPVRGLNAESCKIALQKLCDDSISSEGEYLLPEILFSSSRVASKSTVTVNKEDQTRKATEAIFMGPIEKASGRERWSEESQTVVAKHMKAKEPTPPEDIILMLVELELRREELTVRTLRRQMERMVPLYLTSENLLQYKKLFWRTHAPSTQNLMGERGNCPWSYESTKALVEAVKDPPRRMSTISGVKACRAIARVLNKKGIRSSRNTHQSVRHRLLSLMELPLDQRHGLTDKEWMRIHNPRKYNAAENTERNSAWPHRKGRDLKPCRDNQRKENVAPPTQEAVTDDVKVTAKNGFVVMLNADLQQRAMKEYFTPDRLKEAYQRYVDSHIN